MADDKKTADQLRSARWFGPDDLRSFGHRSRMMQMGLAPEDWEGRPVIGILNTWSELNPCHLHFRDRAEDVKKGIAQAGGLGLEVPTISIDESFTKPTSMLYRNMIAMETEETIRSHPLDGVVLMGGCDKSTPGLTMGAISAGVPFLKARRRCLHAPTPKAQSCLSLCAQAPDGSIRCCNLLPLRVAPVPEALKSRVSPRARWWAPSYGPI